MNSKEKIKTAFLTWFILQLLVLQPVCARGTQSNENIARDLDTLLTTLYKNKQFNGAVLVSQRGKVIFKKAYGYANFETKTMLTTKTPFYLASVAKPFTAMGIMILAERGKLDYEDSIAKFIPELEHYKTITIRHLLNHTGGLIEYQQLFRGNGWDESKVTDNNDLIDWLQKLKPGRLFEPGDRYSYSNTGYVLLASIVAKASGRSYPVFLKENIFDPLGMRNSFAYNKKMKKCPQERAMGYFVNGPYWRLNDLTFMDGVMGDGNVYSSVEDLYKFDRALYTEKLVKKKTLAGAFTPARLNNGGTNNYGFGWTLSYDGRSVQHMGLWVGFRTMLYRHIATDSTLIFLDNSSNRLRGHIIGSMFSCIRGEKYTLPPQAAANVIFQTVMEKDVDTAIRQYHELKRTGGDNYSFSENDLNIVGYQLLNMTRIDDAIRVLKLNTEEYPRSGNVYDSLGEAYLKKGSMDLAIKSYRKSLELNPSNINAVRVLEKLTKK